MRSARTTRTRRPTAASWSSRCWAIRNSKNSGAAKWTRCATASTACGGCSSTRSKPRACRATIRSSPGSAACSRSPASRRSTSKRSKKKYAIYIVGSGRINVAGITKRQRRPAVRGDRGGGEELGSGDAAAGACRSGVSERALAWRGFSSLSVSTPSDCAMYAEVASVRTNTRIDKLCRSGKMCYFPVGQFGTASAGSHRENPLCHDRGGAVLLRPAGWATCAAACRASWPSWATSRSS